MKMMMMMNRIINFIKQLIRNIATTHLCELINKNTIYKAFVEFGEGETHLRVIKKICL